MVTRRNYRCVDVNQIDLEAVREQAIARGGVGTVVGLDIAKAEIVVTVRWPDRSFERPWKVANPTQIHALIDRLKILREVCDSLSVGLESTGTYGDAVRLAMTRAGLDVQRISGKAVEDYKEIFDGVPSQHDGKDAAIIAELVQYGKGTPWPYTPPSEADQQMQADVHLYAMYVDEKTRWLNRIEALLARHWPELTESLGLTTVTLLEVCSHYGSPARLCADPEAAQNLRRWSRAGLRGPKLERMLESARTTAGLPMSHATIVLLAELADNAKRCRQRLVELQRSMRQQATANADMQRLVEPVGAPSLCGIWATVGDPARYDSSGAFVKALGLNLKELSSGTRKGQLAITKRGNSHARRILYYWAMRAVQRSELKNWYTQFQRVGRSGTHRNSEHRKMKGLVATMRRLAAALWHCRVHDEPFDYAKVFPGRPLQTRTSTRRRRRKRSAVSKS